ncbi:MAG TPA: 2Fe-2S iron-sulfur cluster-binding protein [Candidatus Limnocylindrales bacterium]|nr:2Fe-2S iron-sulfur cluster-binding protein [Candidatus Limnocylindrales bacterium]
MTDGRVVVDGTPIEYREGDSVAVAILRAGEVPGHGGCLCLAGDCGNCLAEVDGVAYVRTCQVAARPGSVVRRHPAEGKPQLPVVDLGDPSKVAPRREERVNHLWVDAIVVGAGASGIAAADALRAAGREPSILDAGDGEQVMGIYPGPGVVMRNEREIPEMVHYHAAEVLVATGTAELQPVCEGSRLAGILTPRAADRLEAAGVDLGRVARVGRELLRFEGDDRGRITGVVTTEDRIQCDTAVVDLGRAPRDVLARMSKDGSVTAAGSVAEEHPLPAAPSDLGAVVCPCMGTTVADLQTAFDKGYQDLELLKRASWAGLGPCQGGACVPHVRAFIAARTGVVPNPFTARPAARQITLAEAAADTTIDAFRRTPLHDEHLALGARMDRFGGWFRPWHYGDVVGEYWAVREGVSIGDVSTLGKLIVSGPDVVEALERIYPCHVADIKPGRSRYALLLNERGHVMDDGMILRDAETRFTLSFTSGGAANAEMWIRDWVDTWGLRVHVMDRTMSLAAINVTGPFAGELLRRLGLAEPPRFLSHVRAELQGAPCHVMRLSFTGEAAFELHHPVDQSVGLWRALLDHGEDLGIRPHGLQALFGLRLEKGHVIVGMDTELDTTPRRLGMDWAARMDKPFFIGRAALERTAKLEDQRRWMGFSMDGAAPAEGAPIRSIESGDVIGNVTGSWTSPLLGKALMLGWQRRTPFADRVEIDGREAVVTPTPFYDPEGRRARA